MIAALPFIPGHEAVGVVVKNGPGSKLKIGQRVAVENHFYCENCCMCDENRYENFNDCHVLYYKLYFPILAVIYA